MYEVKQSTALTLPFFVHDVSGDAVTGLTDGSFTKRISKNGAAFAAMTVTITELENGWYSIPLSASHSDTIGLLSITFTNAGAKQANLQFRVEAKLIDDLNDVAATDIVTAGAITTLTGAVVNVDTVDSLTANADKTGYSLAATGLDAIVATAVGMVEIAKAIWDRVLSGATHNILNSAGRRLRQLQEAGGYGGFVWIDTAAGTAGTTSFEHGTDTKPVLTLADALTIAGNVNIKNYMVTRDSVLAPVADFNNFTVYGTGYTFTLGGFDYAGTHIFHASPLTGTATSINNSDHFDVLDSIVGNVTVDDAHFTNCAFTGTITLGAINGTLRLVNCFSLVVGSGSTVLDFGTTTDNHNANIVDWQGSLEVRNFNVVTTGGTDTLNITGTGELIIASTCDGGTINLRGQWEITDNSGGAVTITQDDVATSVIAIEADTADMQPKIGTPAADVSADIAAIKAETALIVLDTNELQTDDVPGLIAALNDLSAAQVNTEMVDVMDVDTIALPGQVAPPLTPTRTEMMAHNYKAYRNRKTQTATQWSLLADDESTVDQKATVSDDATTAIKEEIVSGP